MSVETARAWLLPFDSTAPGLARRLVGRVVTPSDDALLAVSELVTNAVRHGRGPIELRVAPEAGALRIDVVCGHGAGDPTPTVQRPGPASPGGRGLRIVEEIADAWEWSIEGARLTVWARVSR